MFTKKKLDEESQEEIAVSEDLFKAKQADETDQSAPTQQNGIHDENGNANFLRFYFEKHLNILE